MTYFIVSFYQYYCGSMVSIFFDHCTLMSQANSTEPLKVEVAVLDQYMVQEAKELKLRFPDWVDVVAYTSFMSSYSF